uniref:Uncharacterized protein n=1 Tax=Anguilla anguilla TaxID=7936 RepID=A0A0E9PKQ9_ANGAN
MGSFSCHVSVFTLASSLQSIGHTWYMKLFP